MTATSRQLRVPCSLVKNPTDLGAAWPYGGEDMGLAQFTTLSILERRSPPITDEAKGGDTTDMLYKGEGVLMSTTFTQWELAIVSSIYRGVLAGTGTTPQKVYNASSSRGVLLSTLGAKILCVPTYVKDGAADGLNDSKALSFLLYNAVGFGEDPIAFTGFLSATLSAGFAGFPDATGRVKQIATFGDLVL